MKIVMDLQCCQTAARNRGMGRFSLSLSKAIVERGANHQFLILLNSRLLSSSSALLREIETWNSDIKLVAFDYPALGHDPDERPLREHASNILRNDRVETLSADVYHISSLYEGDSIVGPAAPFISLPKSPVITSATLYDVIPSRFPSPYLDYPPTAKWYQRTMATARELDLLLAISDASARDAERFLGISPSKVVNILGSIGSEFRVLRKEEAFRGAVWNTVDRSRPFVLYVGGPDFRKNIGGAFEGFVEASKRLAVTYRFVFVLDHESTAAKELMARAAEAGFEDRVVITGFVSDQDLVELYNACAVFVFPSLYEGLGLPVIEAMTCGAPVLVGDNSSLIEIVPDANYRFDASSASAIGNAIFDALNDPTKIDRMRTYGRERAQAFSWDESAKRALDAWDSRYKQTLRRSRTLKRPPRVAMFSPLPNEKTGIADYMADFLPSLGAFAAIEVFVEDLEIVTVAFEGIKISHHASFVASADTFDIVIYQLGNSPYHHYMLPYLERHPGVVVLHDAYVGYLTHRWGQPEIVLGQALREVPHKARAMIATSSSMDEAAATAIDLFSCGALHVERSLGVIVHSEFARSILADASNPAAAPEIRVIPQYRAAIAPTRKLDKAAARRRLGVDVDHFIVTTFGHVASTKGILELIAAFAENVERQSNWRLFLVGELEGGPTAATPYAQSVLAAIKGRDDIKITGFVDQDTYDLWLGATDVGVQLRTISRGETSGAMLNLLMNGVPFIFNRTGAASELPADVAVGLPSHTSAEVADAIATLASDPAYRARLGVASLEYARQVLDPNVVAATFIAAAAGMTMRARGCGSPVVAGELSRLFHGRDVPRPLISELASAFVRQERSEDRPRLLIEVSRRRARRLDIRTAIDDDVLRLAFRMELAGARPRAVAVDGGKLVSADAVAASIGAILECEGVRVGDVELRPFDKLLFQHPPTDKNDDQLFSHLEALGGSVYGVIDDVSQFTHPELHPSRRADTATIWMTQVLDCGGAFICGDVTAADDLIRAIETRRFRVKDGFRIGVVARHATPSDRPISNHVATIAERPNLFLLSGPISAKAHPIAIQAFGAVRTKLEPLSLALIGQIGWDDTAQRREIERHRDYGTSIVDMGIPTSVDLAGLYRGAAAMLVLSDDDYARVAIADALGSGVPLIVLDTPDLRRRAGATARYVPLDETAIAAAMLDATADEHVTRTVADSVSVDTYATNLFAFVAGSGAVHHQF